MLVVAERRAVYRAIERTVADCFAAPFEQYGFESERRVQVNGLVLDDPYSERRLIELELELLSRGTFEAKYRCIMQLMCALLTSTIIDISLVFRLKLNSHPSPQ
jgi:hypothetical protein